MVLIDYSSLSPEERQALFNGPALAPPPGVISNLENPPNNNAAGNITLALCIFLSTIAVCNRTYANYVLSKPRLPDCKPYPPLPIPALGDGPGSYATITQSAESPVALPSPHHCGLTLINIVLTVDRLDDLCICITITRFSATCY